ncbi:hypothetical protein GNP82_16685 [Aliivibrio fischeri]|uniref:hypothetical protein n=1 Tax=Aliivibrio fischeri TaxID=668 RepID=UPI0012D8A097|nr:hypothetical protein [Aliivibrio fischeri]MUK39190.1 hypothetical protein [Aliivibrio fischeri]MUL04110.1 hypothetical protein [Aliivibrio fischeri]MUL06664.1 hypothetical protein [Aliivibrio fischeri]
MPNNEYLGSQFYKRLKKTYLKFNYVSLDTLVDGQFAYVKKTPSAFTPFKQRKIIKSTKN